MTTITVDDRLSISLEIEDAEGEDRYYSPSPTPPGLDLWACVLTRRDSGGAYRVALEQTGKWRCSCPDFRYRGKGKGCKHTRSAAGMKAILDLFERSEGPPAQALRQASAGERGGVK